MNFLNKTMQRALLGLFAAAFVFMLLQPFTDAGFVEPLSVILLAVGLFLFLRWLYQKLATWNLKRLKVLIFGLFVLFIGLEIFWVLIGHAATFGDPWHMQAQATRLLNGAHDWDVWIRMYPNLVPMVALELGFMKLAAALHLSYYVIFYGFNIVINTAIWALVVRFLWRKKPFLAAFGLVLILMLPFASNFLIQVAYSDGLAILALLLLVDIFNCAIKNGRLSLWQFLASFLIFAVAYLARPNVIVLLVALLIIGLLAYQQRLKYQGLWQTAAKLFVACLLGIVLASLATRGIAALVGYDLHNSDAFPVWNWLYESLNLKSVGEWTPTDRDYTLFHKGFSSSKAADIAGIIQRLKDYNLLILPLFVAKFATLWSCGTFATGTDYTLFAGTFNWTQAPGFLVQHIGAINIFWETYAKALMAVLLLAVLLTLWRKRQDLISSFGLMLLTIMGISLFHTLIWEVKPRYQFMTIGLLLIVAVMSSEVLFDEKVFSVKFDRSAKRSVLSSDLLSMRFDRKFKLILTAFSVISIGLMATVMQLQPKQSVVVNAQQHPVDHFGYSPNNKVALAPNQTLYQPFKLPVKANQINWQSGTDAALDLSIQRRSGSRWLTLNQRVLPADNRPAQEVSQIFNVALPAGQYRFALHNSGRQTVNIAANLDVATLDYPDLMRLPDGKQAALGFIISQEKPVSKYSLGLIVLFALIFVGLNLVIWRL